MKKFGFNLSAQIINRTIESIVVNQYFVPKFLDDKLLFKNNKYVIVLDGVVLNKKELEKKYKQENWLTTIIQMYILLGDAFFNELRGSFAGVFYEKKSQNLIVFSDQIGSKFVYYSILNGDLYISTMMDDMYKHLDDVGIKYHLSKDNAYLLLSYGFMIDDRTLCQEVKKIKPGFFLKIQGGKIEEKQYYLLDNTPDRSLNETEWIDRIDETFKKAIKQQFEKDKEYGYKHIVALSAGLDSRMTCWVAHEMGYTDQLNFTFSQSDYYDETIPKQISSDLKHEWIFKALDNGLWLYNIDDITRLSGGNVLYYGLSHAYSLYSKLNFENYGMIHTGQLGDVILGTFYDSKNGKAQFKWGDGAYSETMLGKIRDLKHTKYKNQEISKIYFRGFSGANNGNISEYAFTESFSPFYNLEFMMMAETIPVEFRYGHRIYKKWIIKKYPQAANYLWEKIGCKITRNHGFISRRGHDIRIESIPSIVLNKIIPHRGDVSKRNMNPLGYYIDTNKQLSDYLNSYSRYIDYIDDIELRNDLWNLLKNGNSVELIQASSLLAAIKHYYIS